MDSSFDLTQYEAERMEEDEKGVTVERETYYKPETGMFDVVVSYEPVEVEFRDGKPERCLCGWYRNPDVEDKPIDSCIKCDQEELF